MKPGFANTTSRPSAPLEAPGTTGRLADLHNLPKPRWRDVLRALAGPAERVHAYRNLHSRALDAAVGDECRVRIDE